MKTSGKRHLRTFAVVSAALLFAGCAATPSQSMRGASPGPGKHNSHGPLIVASTSLSQTEGVETVHQPHRT